MVWQYFNSNYSYVVKRVFLFGKNDFYCLYHVGGLEDDRWRKYIFMVSKTEFKVKS